MGAGLYDAVRNILRKHGCVFVRPGKGSHEMWLNPATERKASIAVTVKSRATANGFLKDLGIDDKV